MYVYFTYGTIMGFVHGICPSSGGAVFLWHLQLLWQVLYMCNGSHHVCKCVRMDVSIYTYMHTLNHYK